MTVDVIALRRDFHAYPEPGFCEMRTAGTVAALLEEYGYAVVCGAQVMVPEARMGVPEPAVLEEAYSRGREAGVRDEFLERMKGGLTAVVGMLVGRYPGPVITLRFDMDALPIVEADDDAHVPFALGFRSRYEGYMHACGHDGHTAVGLALAARLSDREFHGQVKLIFQPAEEGLRGARAIAQSGVLDDVDALLCMHLGSGVPTGTIYAGTGGGLASTKLCATFTGRAAHAGMAPEQGRSALLAAAAASLAIHTLPQHGSVSMRANVGRLVAGAATNVVPDHAELGFETRAADTAAEQQLRERAVEAIVGCARAFGVEADVEELGSAGAIVCDTTLVERVRTLIDELSGVEAPHELQHDTGSEDASWLLDRVREHGGLGTYMVVGSDIAASHHARRFDFDERALEIAVNALEHLVREGTTLTARVDGREPLRQRAG